ncbi:tolloid-like protein 1 isoform X2 [Ostrea edulis]|uniref:tolloid-like protein 1 isoform X2 n=1 Tax=Ostrea edulis TaxID=37623 RepID=UPI0024AECF96|nr:tolloid-like protein 1 isoform X2 [Ostrea edulis]
MHLGPCCFVCVVLFGFSWSSDVVTSGLYADPSKAAYRFEDIACDTGGLTYYRNLLRSRQRQSRRQIPYIPTHRTFPRHFRRRRAATADPSRLWQHGVIPYEIHSNFTAYQKAIFVTAMRHWENYTCITFVERTYEPDFIIFTQRPCGCCSFVGRELRGAQAISIGKNCDKFGIVVHELGHVIGFWHEHTRPDRDNYIQILTQNIQENHENNFAKMSMSQINSLGEKYDFSSIMHYARNTFARTSILDTIVPKTKNHDVPEIGQRHRISVGDIIQTNKLYKCPSCGATRQESSGMISFNATNGTTKQCQWRITAAYGEKVNLNITSLSIPDTPDVCSNSYLEIRDGHFQNSRLIGRYCGTTIPPPIESTGNRLWLSFQSSNNTDSGFEANFEAKCGGLINKDYGHLTSPNYPDDYHPNKNCVWVITVSEGYSVALLFDYLEIESHDDCVYDHLEVRDGTDENAPILAMLCGFSPPNPVKSTSNQIYIKFFSDDSVMKRGFSLKFLKEIDECATGSHGCEQDCINTMGGYKCQCKLGYELHSDGKKCEDACGGYLESTKGTIHSPSFPDMYPPSKTCIWQIAAPEQYKISLKFTHLDVEGTNQECEYDYVEVTSGDGYNKPYGRFCGQMLPDSITSESNSLQVKFKSDDSVQNAGFQAEYFIDKDECAVRKGGCQHTCINTIGSYMCACHNGYTLHENKHDCKEDAEGCRHYLNDHRGVIVSPLWPKHYPSKSNCEWSIKTAPGHRIKLTFDEFSVEPHDECIYDYIEVFTTPTKLLGKFCGGIDDVSTNIISEEEELIIKFKSDESVQRKGFQATYSSVCGGNLNAMSEAKVIYSHAKYGDQNYPKNIRCQWTIRGSPGSNVSLSFSAFDLEDSKECAYDVVELYDGAKEKSKLLGAYCDVEIPPTTITTSDTLILIFKSDSTVTWKGFAAEYQEIVI